MFFKQLGVKWDAAILLKDLFNHPSLVGIYSVVRSDISTIIVNDYYKNKIYIEDSLSETNYFTYAALSLDYFISNLPLGHTCYLHFLQALEGLIDVSNNKNLSELDKALLSSINVSDKKMRYFISNSK